MISKEEVLKVAKLARLELNQEEVERMQKDLSSILDYFEILKKAKSKKSSMDSSMVLRENVVRKDEAVDKPASLANNLIGAAPERKDSYIKVKQVL